MRESGMSLIEVLLAGALMAGLGLVVARISDQSQKVTKTTETNMEMLALTQDISYILSDKDSCVATVQGAVGNSLSGIRKVKDGVTTEVYSLDSLYGNNTYRLSRLTTELNSGGVNLVIDMDRASQSSLGGRGIRKKIPLKAVLSADNSTIETCFSDMESMIETAVRSACQGNSARYDSDLIECHHDLRAMICEPGKVMQQIVTENGEIKSECMPIIPTAMNCGPGEFIKSITLDGVTTCEPLDTRNPSCQLGQYAVALQNGEISCRDIPRCGGGAKSFLTSNPTTGDLMCLGLSCDPANQYFAGFDDSGATVCKNFPDRTCGQGQYIKEVRADGVVECGEVPNHVSLARVDYSFVDGFDQATNTWSRKSLIEVAQRMCESFVATTWNGTRCQVNTPLPPSPEEICATIEGGRWNGTKCEIGKILRNCAWSSANNPGDYHEDARWGIRKCPSNKVLAAGSCSCSSNNCNGTATLTASKPVYFEPHSSIMKCTNTSECNDATRIVCHGMNCNAWDCGYSHEVGRMYVSLLCCDYE